MKKIKVDPKLVQELKSFKSDNKIEIMEVCGTHTVAIHRFGIHKILPQCVKLVSGPGCPVCVTPDTYIDEAVWLARKGTIITTFGDMLKVPGSVIDKSDLSKRNSLNRQRADGNAIKIVYSPMDALAIAEKTDKEVVFLSVGFETTIPGIALTVKKAKEKNIKNFSILTANKTVPNALMALLGEDSQINGFILPGHVSTVLGTNGYDFLKPYKVSSVITGFEPNDIITSILKLINMIKNNDYSVVNNYTRVVRDNGNPLAKKAISEVFKPNDTAWRGIGVIPQSGLILNENYRNWDTRIKFDIAVTDSKIETGCQCGLVLKGILDPPKCPLFRKVCHPDNPVGPCMVSQEGSCSAWYWYG